MVSNLKAPQSLSPRFLLWGAVLITSLFLKASTLPACVDEPYSETVFSYKNLSTSFLVSRIPGLDRYLSQKFRRLSPELGRALGFSQYCWRFAEVGFGTRHIIREIARRLYDELNQGVTDLNDRFMAQTMFWRYLPPEEQKVHKKRIQRWLSVFPQHHDRVALDFFFLENEYDFPTGPRYSYSSAIRFISNGFFDIQLYMKLKSGHTMLSVGTGSGHLERFLFRGLGIESKSIVTSDLTVHPDLADAGLAFVRLDMGKPWPALGQTFDIILFPQSFNVAFESSRDSNSSINHDPQLVGFVVRVFSNALRYLKPRGEIRVEGHKIHGVIWTDIKRKLQNQHKCLKLWTIGTYPKTLVIKRKK